jgi:hypothetical protein
MRLPGTGIGVARLVLVSIVKVDMGGASSGTTLEQPVSLLRHPADNQGTLTNCCSSGGQVRGRFAQRV